MLFHRLDYLILFGITLLGQYFIKAQRFRILFLLIMSYIFYMWDSKLNGIYIFFSTIVAYFTSIKVHETHRKFYLILNLFINFSLLIFFKSNMYFILFFQKMIPSLKEEFFSLPLGLSFYTFQAVSYCMDVYRKEVIPEKNFFTFSLYHSFFPQLVAGPIERVSDLLPQLKQLPVFNYDNFKKGLLIFTFALIKKRVIADRLAMIGELILNNSEKHSSSALLFGGYCISFQYYCDFSAYSEMALGSALMMGINLKRNFKFPFLATSPIEFWRRWHITLMSWLHDYIYRPILSLDLSYTNMLFATFVVFLFAGVWHGFSINFLIWGIVNGVVVIINMIFKKSFSWKAPYYMIPIKVLATFHVFVLNGVFLFFETPIQAITVLKKIISLNSFALYTVQYEVSRYDLILAAVFTSFLFLLEIIFSKISFWDVYNGMKKIQRWSLYVAALVVLILYSYSISRSYVYFKF